MVPSHLLDQSGDTHRTQFFDRVRTAGGGGEEWVIRQTSSSSSSGRSSSSSSKPRVVPSSDPIQSLTEIICADSSKKRRLPPSETGNTARNYELFVDLIYRMLAYDPDDRINPDEALNHAFIRAGEQQPQGGSQFGGQAVRRGSVDDIPDPSQSSFQLQNFGTGQRKREALPSQRPSHR